jgi:hypothetical protein
MRVVDIDGLFCDGNWCRFKNFKTSHKMKPEKDGGTLPGDLMTQEILQTRDQKQKIEGQSKIK